MAIPSLPRVLVVDDEPMLRRVIARELRGSFEVLEAAGAEEAAQVLGHHKDLVAVVTDLDMPPGPGGIEVLEEAQRQRPAALRILLSGRAAPEEVEGHLKSELIDRFFQKPWLPGELLRALQEGVAGLEVPSEEAVASLALEPPGAEAGADRTSRDWRIAWRLCRNHGLASGAAVAVFQETMRRVLALSGGLVDRVALVVTTTHEVAAEHRRRLPGYVP